MTHGFTEIEIPELEGLDKCMANAQAQVEAMLSELDLDPIPADEIESELDRLKAEIEGLEFDPSAHDYPTS